MTEERVSGFLLVLVIVCMLFATVVHAVRGEVEGAMSTTAVLLIASVGLDVKRLLRRVGK